MEAQKAVLAKYDFRVKQTYIYRTNRIKEIAGASRLISEAYEFFLSGLIGEGWQIAKNFDYDSETGGYVNLADKPFVPESEDADGSVLNIGGGNLIILWQDQETAVRANQFFSRQLIRNAYGLYLVCGITAYTGRYTDDIEHLNKAFQTDKSIGVPPVPTAMLPFTEFDRKTSLPIVEKRQYKIGEDLIELSLSQESVCKLDAYKRAADLAKKTGDNLIDKVELDEIVTEKGTESLLAVIYIDGNGMGDRVRNTMEDAHGELSYQEAVERIRAFSNDIQANYVTKPIAAIRDKLREKHHSQPRLSSFRQVIAGGDEITIICNARVALEVVDWYFQTLCGTGHSAENTACAGIAVFHSHAPFAIAYKVAEACCEEAKKCNRKHGNNNCLVDFQFCYSGSIGELDDMRQQDGEYMLRPYCWLNQSQDNLPSLGAFMQLGEKLSDIGRRNVKTLIGAKLNTDSEYAMEMARIQGRYPGFALDEREEAMFFDAAQFFDLWFVKENK